MVATIARDGRTDDCVISEIDGDICTVQFERDGLKCFKRLPLSKCVPIFEFGIADVLDAARETATTFGEQTRVTGSIMTAATATVAQSIRLHAQDTEPAFAIPRAPTGETPIVQHTRRAPKRAPNNLLTKSYKLIWPATKLIVKLIISQIKFVASIKNLSIGAIISFVLMATITFDVWTRHQEELQVSGFLFYVAIFLF